MIVDSFGSPSLKSDLAAFDTAFGLPTPSLTVLAPLGARRQARLVGQRNDARRRMGACGGARARIVVLESPVDETEGLQGLPEFLKLEQYAVSHHLADVISQSWGATEETLFTPEGRRMVARFHHSMPRHRRGVSPSWPVAATWGGRYRLVVGAPLSSPRREFPASDPLVLAVGGTTLGVDARGRVQAR